MNITDLIIKDVRCFAGAQKFAIRPITFLVGKNSTGKSTALGCLQMLHNSIYLPKVGLDFNAEPYLMGTFSDIVRKSRPSIKEFQIGIGVENGSKGATKYCLTVAKKDEGSKPIIQQHQILFQDGSEIAIKQKNKYQPGRRSNKIRVRLREQGKRPIVFEAPGSVHYPLLDLLDSVRHEIKSSHPKAKNISNKLGRFIKNIAHLNINSFAPIRSKPNRIYDPIQEEWNLEESKMHTVLNNISESNRWKTAWNKLEKELAKFGKSSDLYKEISVKKLGKSKADPFQLQVKVRGPKANLIDVGYGVSQILPMLVRIFLTRPTTFLMQQPEVHLHPEAQAELSSLLVNTAQTIGHNFVIETHSEHMVDRTRIEIMQGHIKPQDVSLIYLQPNGNKVEVHNIEFDKNANMKGEIGGYQDFLLKETDRLLACGED